MKKRKFFTLFAVVTILWSAVVPSMLEVSAQSLDDTIGSLAFVSNNKEEITSDSISEDESKPLIVQTSSNYKGNVVVTLPQGLTLDLQASQILAQESGVVIGYDTSLNSIEINYNNAKVLPDSDQNNYNQYVKLIVKGSTKGTYDVQAKASQNGINKTANIRLNLTGNSRSSDLNTEATPVTEEGTKDDSDADKPRFSVRSGNKNIDLDISPVSETVSAGQDATFALNFKVTGNQTNYTNAKITVDIPKEYDLNQELSELVIAGVAPTRDAATGQLIYNFTSIPAGQAYTTNIKLKTVNGTTPDGTAITLTSNFSANEFSGSAESTATVTIEASSSLSVSKSYESTLDKTGKSKTTPPTAGDTGTWKILVNAGQKDTGASYFKEGSKITVKDIIPQGLSYVSDDANGTYDKATNTVTWTYDAPTYEQQKNAVDSLFSKEIKVNLKFNDDIENFATFKNNVEVQALNVNGVVLDVKSSGSITTGNSNPNVVPPGNYFIPNHGGPVDGKGTSGSAFNSNNPDPVVYDSALLTFSVSAMPGSTNSPTKDFKKYNVSYDVDPNLNLTRLAFSGWARYQPDTSYPDNVPSADPRADIYVTVNGVEKKVISDSVYLKKSYTLKDLGIDPNAHVSNFRIVHTYAPAGMLTPFLYPQFTVKKGFTGTVTNKVNYDVTGFDKSGNEVSWNRDGDYNVINSLTGPRTAEVVPIPPDSLPIAKSDIKFDKSDNGVVKVGENRITGSFVTDKASSLPLNNQLSSMVLLPVGVKIDTTKPEYQLKSTLAWDDATTDGNNANGTIKVAASDFNGTGRQLVKVTWNTDKLYPGQSLQYGFNTIIDKTAPTPLRMDTYGFSGDAKISVPSGAATLTDSYLQTDTDDINGNGNTTESRVLSSNQYRMIKENKVETTKLVKGDQDKSFSKFGHTSPGGKIDYQLTMKNTGSSIGTFALMDVLPSIGDLGITDNVERDSKFAPIMTGPISLPGEWNGKVTIKYSEATNPKRDDLDKLVDYPSTTQHLENPAGSQLPQWKTADQVSDWSKIHSFIVTLDDGQWTSGTAITLNFSMKAPNNLTSNLVDQSKDEQTRAAWNSFAYTADNSQVVEPERVGIVVNATEPVIHKDVEEKQQLDLTNRDQAFDWHVNAEFEDGAGSWTQASIVDQINPLLTINSVKVVDETGKDVTANGTITTDNNKVVFEINKKDDGYTYLAGHTYTMTINTVIGKDVTDEQLAPYIKDGGIPNQADLNFGNDGDVIRSEIPTVTPRIPDAPKDFKTPKDPGNLPKTGENHTGIMSFLGILVVAAIILYGLISLKRRKK